MADFQIRVAEPRNMLSAMVIDEIGFVGVGANQGADILFYKRKPRAANVAKDCPDLVQKRVSIIKVDEAERIVYAWASIVEVGDELVSDWEGDVCTVADLEKAAYGYLEEGRGSSELHERLGVATLVASVPFTHEVQKALDIDLGMVGWLVGFRVDDDVVWKGVQDGTYRMLSIGGHGVRTPISDGIAKTIRKVFGASTAVGGGEDDRHAHDLVLPGPPVGAGSYLTEPGGITNHVHGLSIPRDLSPGDRITVFTDNGGLDGHQHEVEVAVPEIVQQRKRPTFLEKLRKLMPGLPWAQADAVAKIHDDSEPRTFEEIRDDMRAFGVWDALDDRTIALSDVFWEILHSTSTDKERLMAEALTSFASVTETDIPRLLAGEIVKSALAFQAEAANSDEMRKHLSPLIEKARTGADPTGSDHMKFDLSKIADEEVRKAVEEVLGTIWKTAADRGDTITELEAKVEKAKQWAERVAKAGGLEAEPTEPEGGDATETLLKALPDDVRGIIAKIVTASSESVKKASERVEKVEGELVSLKKAARDKELHAIAKSLQGVGGKSEEEMFSTLSKADEKGGTDAVDAVVEALEIAKAALEESALFEEIGAGGDGATADANEALEKIAKSYQAKDPELTDAGAFTKAMERNPELAQDAVGDAH